MRQRPARPKLQHATAAHDGCLLHPCVPTRLFISPWPRHSPLSHTALPMQSLVLDVYLDAACGAVGRWTASSPRFSHPITPAATPHPPLNTTLEPPLSLVHAQNIHRATTISSSMTPEEAAAAAAAAEAAKAAGAGSGAPPGMEEAAEAVVKNSLSFAVVIIILLVCAGLAAVLVYLQRKRE